MTLTKQRALSGKSVRFITAAIFREVFAGAKDYVDRERVEAIAASVNQRIQMLETFILTQQPQVDSTENDVEENAAAAYRIKSQTF